MIRSFEEGSVFPMAMATASVALFTCLSLPRPTGPDYATTPQSSGFLIWGASSSIGVSTLQLARNLGFKVFATASPAHHAFLKKLGASAVFDYRDPEVIQKIVTAAKEAGTPIKYGLDAIGENETFGKSAETILSSGGKGGKLVVALPWPKEQKLPEGLEVIQDLGAYRHATDAKEMGTWFFNEYFEKVLEDQRVVAAPEIQIVDGGVGAAQAALDLVKKGVSGKKIVVKVD
jgi:NADPH:quinone reductase-like Zn-dependent oxidoreductase